MANLSSAELSLPYYPFTFAAPNGKLFLAGPGQTTKYLNTSGTGQWTVVGNNKYGTRNWGTAVMYDIGKVLITGGSGCDFYSGCATLPTEKAEVIDLNSAQPSWNYVAPMTHRRKHHNATILPDGKVLITGGTKGAEPTTETSTDPASAAEVWDPETNTWTVLASLTRYRGYHAIAMLLPDGRILSGSGEYGGKNMEIYSPPYLFKGARPTITNVPASVGYGQAFSVATPNAAEIQKVTWISLSSVTHSFNLTQRFNKLNFVKSGNGLTVTAPAGPNVCPPGYYMLFIVNGNGVPSVAKMIRVDSVALRRFPSPLLWRLRRLLQARSTFHGPTVQRLSMALGSKSPLTEVVYVHRHCCF